MLLQQAGLSLQLHIQQDLAISKDLPKCAVDLAEYVYDD